MPGRANLFFAALVQQFNKRKELGFKHSYNVITLCKSICESALKLDFPQLMHPWHCRIMALKGIGGTIRTCPTMAWVC